MAELQLEGLSKAYPGGVDALKGISLHVRDREAVFLLGPSGAGKTTTLRLVSGLEEATDGRITLGGEDVTGWSPRDRNVAMVYDKHSLFPHLTVFDNMAYPLRNRRQSDREIRERIQRVAAVLQVETLLERYPSQLSGGQMQRVAIGRALVRDAQIFLLDEPISHLDAQLRARMRVEFKRLQREFDATMLYVSHDQLEAMTMADRIVLIKDGEIEQIAPPQEMYDRPDTVFAATFLGEPAMNILPAELREEAGVAHLAVCGSEFALGADWLAESAQLPARRGFLAGFRPQQITLADEAAPGTIPGRIFAVEALGSRYVFDIAVGDGNGGGEIVRVVTTVDDAQQHAQAIDAPIRIRLDPDHLYLFDAETGRTVRQATLHA